MQSGVVILCSLTSTTVTTDSVNRQQRTRSACLTVQADLGLQIAYGPFSCVAHHIVKKFNYSRLSLSRTSRDLIKMFELSVVRDNQSVTS